jgi:heme oxygenase
MRRSVCAQRACARRATQGQIGARKYLISPFLTVARELQTSPAVDQASTALMRLNLETRSFHSDADEGWLALLRPQSTRSDYMHRLVTVYGFEAPLEAACAYTPNLKLFIDLRQRSRAGLIARDLLALELRANELSGLPQCLLAPFSGPIEAIGWLYVTERATLLHERVRAHLLAQLPDVNDAVAYVSAYEGVANARWNELGHAMDRAIRSQAHMDDVIAAAKAGFRRVIDWSGHRHAYARGA